MGMLDTYGIGDLGPQDFARLQAMALRRPVGDTTGSWDAPPAGPMGGNLMPQPAPPVKAQARPVSAPKTSTTSATSLPDTPPPAQTSALPNAMAQMQASRAKAEQEMERMQAPPDYSGMAGEAQRRQGESRNSLIMALAAQNAGKGFEGMQGHYLKQSAQQGAPMQVEGGYINDQGEAVIDPAYKHQKDLERQQRKITALDQMIAHADNADQQRVLQREKIASEEGLKRMLMAQTAAFQGASLGLRRDALNLRMLGNPESLFSPSEIEDAAHQLAAGDTSVLQNMGRGESAGINAKRVKARALQLAGSGESLAAANLGYAGDKAGVRAAGTQSARLESAASGVEYAVPLALEASQNVPRGQFVPINKLMQMADTAISDPALLRLKLATQNVSNDYAGVLTRGGMSTVEARNKSDQLFQTVTSHEAYAAAMDQVRRETQAARKAQTSTRQGIANRVSSGAGGGEKHVSWDDLK